MASTASAQGTSSNGSCSKLVAASPNDAYKEHPSFVQIGNCKGKISVSCSPAGAPTKSKTLELKATGWVDGSSGTFDTSPVTVTGEILTGCVFSGNVEFDSDQGAYTKLILETTEWEDEGVFEDPLVDVLVTTRVWVALVITDYGASSHDSYAKGEVYLSKNVKRQEYIGGVPGAVLSNVSSQSGREKMNAWAWEV